MRVDIGLLNGMSNERSRQKIECACPDEETIVTNRNATGSSQTSRLIKAPRETVYRAFVEPALLERWQAPDGMTATVHAFDARAGGGYEMSLRYPDSEPGQPGKTTEREDRYTSRFVELVPPERIVEAIRFDTAEPAFMGEMIMTVTLEATPAGTEVTMRFGQIPPGIRPEDNDAGTRSSLAKLASLVENDDC